MRGFGSLSSTPTVLELAMFRFLIEALVETAVAETIERSLQAKHGGRVDAQPKNGFDDPVYKKNLERLIERNRRFEEESKNR